MSIYGHRVLGRLPIWITHGTDPLNVTIGTFPDNVLLEIFHFYVDDAGFFAIDTSAWQTLIHVCQKWRHTVFASPRRLKLRLDCTERQPAREMLDIWPAFLPIVVSESPWVSLEHADNIVAALEHNDRVREISLWRFPTPESERFVAAMQKPFPALEYLDIRLFDDPILVLPDSFLGGSAPRLRTLHLVDILFPALTKLLLSTSHLVELDMLGILGPSTPHAGYVSPEAMVACLSMLTRLETLRFGFISPRSRPGQPSQLLTPFKRVIILSLSKLEFRGVCEYLEDLVARIDAPVLCQLRIRFFNQLIFGVTQLHQFIGRTEKLTAPNHADIFFSENNVEAILFTQAGSILLGVSCHGTDWQLSFLSQVCGWSLPAISIERLDIREDEMPYSPLRDDVENAQWLELLLPFIAVTELYLSEELALRCVPALQQLVGEVGIGALPTLQNLFLETPAIRQCPGSDWTVCRYPRALR